MAEYTCLLEVESTGEVENEEGAIFIVATDIGYNDQTCQCTAKINKDGSMTIIDYKESS